MRPKKIMTSVILTKKPNWLLNRKWNDFKFGVFCLFVLDFFFLLNQNHWVLEMQ